MPIQFQVKMKLPGFPYLDSLGRKLVYQDYYKGLSAFVFLDSLVT